MHRDSMPAGRVPGGARRADPGPVRGLPLSSPVGAWARALRRVSHQLPDIDPTETAEWLDAFDAVVDIHGRTRARYLLMRMLERAGQNQVGFPATVSTPYVNTIPTDEEPGSPATSTSSGASGPTSAGTPR